VLSFDSPEKSKGKRGEEELSGEENNELSGEEVGDSNSLESERGDGEVFPVRRSGEESWKANVSSRGSQSESNLLEGVLRSKEKVGGILRHNPVSEGRPSKEKELKPRATPTAAEEVLLTPKLQVPKQFPLGLQQLA